VSRGAPAKHDAFGCGIIGEDPGFREDLVQNNAHFPPTGPNPDPKIEA
jgi:hypothetical protein